MQDAASERNCIKRCTSNIERFEYETLQFIARPQEGDTSKDSPLE